MDGVSELGDGRDGSGVGDVERLVLHLTRLQVAEVQVEGVGAADVVREAHGELRGSDVDVTDLAGREVRSGRRDGDCGDTTHEGDGDCDGTDLLGVEA